jgi:uncharacterized protein YdiU (UPF0061 family)
MKRLTPLDFARRLIFAIHMNPFLNLTFEPALETLGDQYFSPVAAANFPQCLLRFRNDRLLPLLGLAPETVRDEDFTEAFGAFQGRSPLLALAYHGYQFGVYNPHLGDGRGFLYGQVRGIDGALYDFGTKGSGVTPYSRGGDGRLTLKGGIREVLAAEALHAQGVQTSRCLSLVETGEQLWRSDEPSPTRSSVMVRFSRSHIRFGTFERLHYLGRSDLIQRLLDHVIAVYYSDRSHFADALRSGSSPEETPAPGKTEIALQDYLNFYRSLVQRVADLSAQWMSVGFCHGVLNTDNMSITGESFDYGPYAFIPAYDLRFTAAYFDDLGRYCFGNQPPICKQNLRLLQDALECVIPRSEMEGILDEFDDRFRSTFLQRMLNRLGFDRLESPLESELVKHTLELLQQNQGSFHGFFRRLRQQFSPHWVTDLQSIPPALFAPEDPNLLPSVADSPLAEQWAAWRDCYHLALSRLSNPELGLIPQRLEAHNPLTALLRSDIETVWKAIDENDRWEPFYELLHRLQTLN